MNPSMKLAVAALSSVVLCLVWFKKGKQFQITTKDGNPLTKEELIKIAKTMVKSN
ncbi:hypothetical protein [Paenibacillus apiarius]|uniref:hypothetical protein n=1 Tax=Paenibacillus apiarius TaxID=46240 RepID=UPI001980C2EB|nr:hypothetical protein [Paenibacillus apiarius]MBN3525008.1 hypothetical protein [Paenibacillus apiarius]